MGKLGHAHRNKVRFAFWGAEERGLIGSTQYVAQLVASGEIATIAAQRPGPARRAGPRAREQLINRSTWNRARASSSDSL